MKTGGELFIFDVNCMHYILGRWRFGLYIQQDLIYTISKVQMHITLSKAYNKVPTCTCKYDYLSRYLEMVSLSRWMEDL